MPSEYDVWETEGQRFMDQVLQVVGAVFILTAYAAAQFSLLDQRSYPYIVFNLVGSAILAWLAWEDRQWGFLLLEGVWALVSLWSLLAVSRSGHADSRPRGNRR